MIVKVSALVLLFFSFNIYAQNTSVKPARQLQENDLEKHLSAAETYQIAGDLINAAIENRMIIAIGLHRLGNISIEEGKYRDAVKTLSESKSYNDNARVRIDLAVAYLRTNEIEKALEEARTAVNLDQDNAYARYILGNIYYTKGDYAAALPELEKVLLTAPNFDSARALGLTYLHLKQLERAKLLFEEMQGSLKKENAGLHIIFGQAFEQTDYPLEAEREFKRAIAIDPKQPRANFYLGYVILQHGGSDRIAEAGAAFEKELLLTPDDFYSNFFAGVAASSENRHEKAIEYLEKAVRLNPSSGEAYLFLGQSQIELDDLAAAEKNLRRAVELEESDANAKYQSRRTHFLLGRLLVRTNRREEGEKALAIARKLQQESLSSARDEINQILGQVVKETQVKAGGEGNTDEQSDISPERSAELKKIKPYLSEILAQSFHNLAVIAVQNGQSEDALEKFAAASRWKPDFPGLDRNWGIVGFRAGQFAKAVAPLARHVKANPNDALARQMLGASHYFTQDYKNAVAVLKPLETVITSDAELTYFYGISLIQMEKNSEAKPVFEKLAQVSQNSAEPLNYAAQGFMFLGDYERAVKEFRMVVALAPQTIKANFFIGQSLIRLNRFDEAEKAFRQELQINPIDESAKYHLALTFIERRINTEEAVSLLRDAIRLRLNYADAQYQLGKIYNERGETEKAIEQLEAAARSDDKKDYIRYQLSIAYRKASRTEDAMRELKIYQDLKAANRKNDSPMGSNENFPQ